VYEDFSDEAREVLVLAGDEARNLGHDHIGREHLLLGLLRRRGGHGLAEARQHALREFGPGRDGRTLGELMLTTAVKQALTDARSAAGTAPVNPDHLMAAVRGRALDDGDELLDLASDPDSVTAQALATLDIGLEQLRGAVQAVRRV